MTYLVDTDWVINCLRKNGIFSRRLLELRPEGLALSIISQAEVYEGIYTSRNPEQDQAEFSAFLDEGIEMMKVSKFSPSTKKPAGYLRKRGYASGVRALA